MERSEIRGSLSGASATAVALPVSPRAEAGRAAGLAPDFAALHPRATSTYHVAATMGQSRGCSPRMQDLSCRQRPPKPRLRIHLARPSHEAQHRSHPHHPCRQPDPAAGAAGISARAAGAASRSTRRRTTNASTQSVADVVRQQAEAGIDVVSDGEFGKIDQLVAICAGAAERLRAAADQGRRQSVQARRRPRALRRILCRARCARGAGHRSEAICVGPDHVYRPGGARSATSTTSRRRCKARRSTRRSCRWRRRRA